MILPWPTNITVYSWVLNCWVFRSFCQAQEWGSGQKIVTFQPLLLIHHNSCLGNGSNVHKCPNKKGESKYVRYLTPERMEFDNWCICHFLFSSASPSSSLGRAGEFFSRFAVVSDAACYHWRLARPIPSPVFLAQHTRAQIKIPDAFLFWE